MEFWEVDDELGGGGFGEKLGEVGGGEGGFEGGEAGGGFGEENGHGEGVALVGEFGELEVVGLQVGVGFDLVHHGDGGDWGIVTVVWGGAGMV